MCSLLIQDLGERGVLVWTGGLVSRFQVAYPTRAPSGLIENGSHLRGMLRHECRRDNQTLVSSQREGGLETVLVAQVESLLQHRVCAVLHPFSVAGLKIRLSNAESDVTSNRDVNITCPEPGSRSKNVSRTLTAASVTRFQYFVARDRASSLNGSHSVCIAPSIVRLSP